MQVIQASSNEPGNKMHLFEFGLKREDKLGMPHWMISDKVQGRHSESHSRIERIPEDAPCRPMPSFYRYKHQTDETPESLHSLPSHSLGVDFLGAHSEEALDMSHSSEVKNGNSFVAQLPSSQQINLLISKQPMVISQQFSASVPSKSLTSHSRIQLEVQREGSEIHKENLLSLSLSKPGRGPQSAQKSETSLSSGVADRHVQRVLAKLGSAQMPAADAVHSQQFNSKQLVLPNNHGHTYSDPSLSWVNPLSVKMDCSQIKEATVGKGRVGLSDCQASLSSPLTWEANYDGKQLLKNGERIGFIRPLPATQVYMEQQQHFTDDLCNVDNIKFWKRQKPSSLVEQQQIERTLGFAYYSGAHFPVENIHIYHGQAKKAIKKGQGFGEQLNTPFLAQACDAPVELHDQLHLQRDVLQREFLKKQVNCTNELKWQEYELEMQIGERTTIQTATVVPDINQVCTQELQKGSVCATVNVEPECKIVVDVGNIPEQSANVTRQAANREAIGIKLFTTTTYAQMPKTLSTFSTGELSLPLSLEFSQKLPEDACGKNLSSVNTSNCADWGKFLALSPTPVASSPQIEGNNNLQPYQQRFIKLQAFLKQCDESNHKDHFQALRTLSPAARSGHAVELETRAIRLFLEEGKQMIRMRMLHALGRNTDTNVHDADVIPDGPRLPAPGAIGTIKHL